MRVVIEGYANATDDDPVVEEYFEGDQDAVLEAMLLVAEKAQGDHDYLCVSFREVDSDG